MDLSLFEWALIAVTLAALLYRQARSRFTRRPLYRASCRTCRFAQSSSELEVARTAGMLHHLETKHTVYIEGRRVESGGEVT